MSDGLTSLKPNASSPRGRRKVFVALSGGVDSSVAAALLKRDGLAVPGHPEQSRRVDVVGVYMKCWTASNPMYSGCTSVDDERSARLAAGHLGIPFYSWNFIKEYKKRVVEYMLEGYEKGITPNPDIICNKEIKFGLFFEKAMKLGADFVATGHYTRLWREIRNPKSEIRILQGIDKNKDQSYFLSFIKSEVLSRVLFPIGGYTKPEVRKLAKKFGLPNADRRQSRGICFIGTLDFTQFLKKHISAKPGNIIDMNGKILGRHEGLVLYTIGQRKGIKLSGGPYFVVKKDFKKNELIVSKNENDLNSKEIFVRDMNWFMKDPVKEPTKVEVKIRYRAIQVPATIFPSQKGAYRVAFNKPQRAATPGQFAVFYKGEQMLGGGVIV